MEDGFYPTPMLSVEHALKLYGGWSRMFSRSRETYDGEHIYARDGEPGFWVEFAKAKADEQFREEVEKCCKILKKEYKDERDIRELRMLMANALLAERWKPKKTRILLEIRELKRKKREDIQWLKETVRKKTVKKRTKR